MHVADIRMTLYALVSAFERDLRDSFIRYALPNFDGIEFLKEDNLRKKIKDRFLKDNPGLQSEDNRIELIEYLDYGEILALILQWKNCMDSDLLEDIKARYEIIEQSIGIRNRVMHGRPLDAGDFTLVYGLVADLLHIGKYKWISCAHALKKMTEDPGYVLNLTLPETPVIGVEPFNNLPAPDFDDTGFIGRREDLREVEKLILGPNRVISLIGEGGVGKTALMLKVAYDILDMGEKCPFDAILWVTCKTQALTNSGIENIKDAIDTYIGVIETLEKEIGGVGLSYDDRIEEIISFTEEFSVLIIFDNMETVINDKINEFLRKVQETATIAITSRVGLGELEIRRPLTGMRAVEAEKLLKEHSLIRNVELLKRAKKRSIGNILKKLYYNPLWIKWFVQAVSTGKSPNEVLDHKDSMLEFCMANVYDVLTSEEVKLLNTILTARSSISEPELLFYTGFEPHEYRKCINKLISTSLLERESAQGGACIDCQYSIKPLAREYLFRNKRPEEAFMREIIRKRKELVGMYSSSRVASKTDEFSITSLSLNSKGEKVAGRFLSKALTESRKENYTEANELIERAKSIMPLFYEIYKVSGFINASRGLYIEAEEDYKRALELAPESPRVQFFYGGYLLRFAEDSEAALKHLGNAYKARPDSPTVVIEYARCLGYIGNHDGAIEILRELLKNEKSIIMKHNKIATTLLMTFYKRVAENKYKIGKDVKGAIKALQESIKIYETTTARKDIKLIDTLDAVVSEYRSIVRRINDDEELKIFSKIEKKHKNEIRFKEHYSDDKSEESLEPKITGKNLIGLVYDISENGKYGFIQAENGIRLYFNRKSVKNRNEWQELETGTLVEYVVGENYIGECAVGISIKR